jgi:hypothetical protein
MRTVADGEDALRGRLQTLRKRQDLRPIPTPAPRTGGARLSGLLTSPGEPRTPHFLGLLCCKPPAPASE